MYCRLLCAKEKKEMDDEIKKAIPCMEPNRDLPPVHSKNQFKSLLTVQILAIIAAGAKLKVIRFAGIQIKEALGLYEIPMENSPVNQWKLGVGVSELNHYLDGADCFWTNHTSLLFYKHKMVYLN
jgi:hypothetical protein